MNLNDFTKAIGKEFRVPGLLAYGRWDTILSVDKKTGTVIGEMIEAHYSYCHIKTEQPAQLKNSKLTHA